MQKPIQNLEYRPKRPSTEYWRGWLTAAEVPPESERPLEALETYGVRLTDSRDYSSPSSHYLARRPAGASRCSRSYPTVGEGHVIYSTLSSFKQNWVRQCGHVPFRGKRVIWSKRRRCPKFETHISTRSNWLGKRDRL